MKQHQTPLPDALTLTQAAALLRVSRVNAARALAGGELPWRRQGLRIVVPTVRLLADFGVPTDLTKGGDGNDR